MISDLLEKIDPVDYYCVNVKINKLKGALGIFALLVTGISSGVIKAETRTEVFSPDSRLKVGSLPGFYSLYLINSVSFTFQ